MRSFEDIEARIDYLGDADDAADAVGELVKLGEEVLEHWLVAHDAVATDKTREGFRLLALHRQGAKGVPSFNACRETCRELAYHDNLITGDPAHPDTRKRLRLAALVAKHLYLFVRGKLEEAELGDFCCSSRPMRAEPEESQDTQPVG
jgi:hypothetical protein